MKYEEFRAIWDEAVAAAGMRPYLRPPAETIELGSMNRAYQVYAHVWERGEFDPFHPSACLSWTWDALQATRAAMTEEDLLERFLGDEWFHQDTQRPALVVNATLIATLPPRYPGSASMPLPGATMWRHWLADLTGRLDPLLSTVLEMRDEYTGVFAQRGEPQAVVQPDAGGELSLIEVRLPAWEIIELPRKWCVLDHEQDQDPDEHLADFLDRVWRALHEWKQSLVHLLPPGFSLDGWIV
jgi:hypothetical protein